MALNRLGTPKTDVEPVHAYRNISEYSWIGTPEGAPLASTGVFIPPQKSAKHRGGILPYIAANSYQYTGVLQGPVEGAEKEKAVLEARGAKFLGPRVVDGLGKPIPEGHVSYRFTGVHLILEDITDQAGVIEDAILNDPKQAQELSKALSEKAAAEARAKELEAELAALKDKNAKTFRK